MERPTFSPFWHRVRAMKPRLRPHVQITRQHYRGRRWHVAHDPTSNQFYRLSPIAYDLIGLLDGARTVEEAWKISLSKFGDMAPTQNEVIELLGQLYNSNLLSADASPETEQLLTRGRERVKKRVMQQAIGLMYFKLRLFNPTPILNFIEPILRPVLNRWGFLAWLGLLIFALVQIIPEWPRLVGQFDSVTSPSNWGWMILVYILLKLWHETGHGVICHRFGGQVPEFGVMLLVLIPSPFVDASSCWSFPNKWQRVAVGAGGMMFELFAASIAALVWLASPDGSFAKQISYYVMLTSSISTVVFNANPLMRFDGYYILSDLIEVPNLMMRSNKMLQHLFQRYFYRIKQARPPSNQPGEVAILITYGVLALIYRIFLFVVISLYVLGIFFFVGLFLALWTAAMWFILPIGKFVHWLATSPQLLEYRARAILGTLALAAAGAALLGLVPVPDYRRVVGVVDSPLITGVFQGTDGFVSDVHVRLGQSVKKDEPILTLSSPELSAERQFVIASIADARLRLAEAFAKDDPAGAAVAHSGIAALEEQLSDIARREAALVVRAPHDGTIVGANPRDLLGAFQRTGEPVCQVADLSQRRITASVPQGDSGWLFQMSPDEYRVQARLVSRVHQVIEATGLRAIPAGQRVLPHAALGHAGGGQIATMPDDRSHRVATTDLFTIYVDVDPAQLADAALGQRVYIRFTLPSRPILHQAVEMLQKAVQGKVTL
jgi:putative peptide zinc metalloprotease protein